MQTLVPRTLRKLVSRNCHHHFHEISAKWNVRLQNYQAPCSPPKMTFLKFTITFCTDLYASCGVFISHYCKREADNKGPCLDSTQGRTPLTSLLFLCFGLSGGMEACYGEWQREWMLCLQQMKKRQVPRCEGLFEKSVSVSLHYIFSFSLFFICQLFHLSQHLFFFLQYRIFVAENAHTDGNLSKEMCMMRKISMGGQNSLCIYIYGKTPTHVSMWHADMVRC